jgi:hypothetical protein
MPLLLRVAIFFSRVAILIIPADSSPFGPILPPEFSFALQATLVAAVVVGIRHDHVP